VGVRPWGRSGFGWGYRPGGWTGFHLYGGLRGWYGSYGMYWGGPFSYPGYYGSYVSWWGPSYYPSQPSEDVLAAALPEGVLTAGGRVNGFIYFKRATSKETRQLDLTWSVVDARTNANLGEARVTLDVVAQ
jgi:hypothetical protein